MRLLLLVGWTVLVLAALLDFGQGPWLLNHLGLQHCRLELVNGLKRWAPGLDVPDFITGDLTGDDVDELIVGANGSLLVYDFSDSRLRILLDFDLPQGWSGVSQALHLGPLADLDHDGRQEIPITMCTPDRRQWRLLVLDPLENATLLDRPLPVGEDNQGDSYWDGTHTVVGSLELPDHQQELLVMTTVHEDGHGRAIMAIDAENGETLWRHELGSQPESVWMGELAGLEGPVVVLGSSSPGNLVPDDSTGLADDQSKLQMLDAGGHELWSARLDTVHAKVGMAVVDVDGDGKRDIVTATMGLNNQEPGRLTVWDPRTGQPRARGTSPEHFSGFAAAPALPGDQSTMLAMQRRRELWSYEMEGDLLQSRVVGRFNQDTEVSPWLELLPRHEGLEYLVSTDDGELSIHGSDHRRLGGGRIAGVNGLVDYTQLWQCQERTMLVTLADDQLVPLQLIDTSFGWKVGWSASWFLGLMVAVGIVLVPRRAERNLVELRRILVRDLGQVTSQDFTVLTDLVDYPETIQRTGSTEQRSTLSRLLIPRLQGNLQTLAGAGYCPADFVNTRARLDQLRKLLDDDAGHDQLKLQDSGECRSYRRLSQAVSDDFRSYVRDLQLLLGINGLGVIQTVISRRRRELEKADIVLNEIGFDSAEGSMVLADRDQLRFIMGNLLDNAVEAMATGGQRRLVLEVTTYRQHLHVLLKDSGCGINPLDWETIFQGGSALALSRDMVREWDGELSVAESELGHGTTICLTLQRLSAAT